MVKLRVGTIPFYRLRNARLVRDALAVRLPGHRVFVTLVDGGFGVHVYQPRDVYVEGLHDCLGVPVRVQNWVVKRPRR